MDNNRCKNINVNASAVPKKNCSCSESSTSHDESITSEKGKNISQPETFNQICNTIKEYDNDLLGEGDTVHVNLQLNEVFMRRLHDIDTMAGNNLELKVVTYQEWVDTLLFVNENLLSCIVELESGIAERVAEDQQVSEIPNQASKLSLLLQDQKNPLANELAMVRRDIDRMKTLVRCGFFFKNWDVKDLKFETIDADELFREEDSTEDRSRGGMQHDFEHLTRNVRFNPVHQMNKIDVNVKALAYEVADKHDEIRELKKQINSLEEEIQNAQKKIQLKDNVIKELRTDLKSNAIKVFTTLGIYITFASFEYLFI